MYSRIGSTASTVLHDQGAAAEGMRLLFKFFSALWASVLTVLLGRYATRVKTSYQYIDCKYAIKT